MAVQAMKAGAVDFITKPFDDEALLGAVRTAMAKARRDRAGGAERPEDREPESSGTPSPE